MLPILDALRGTDFLSVCVRLALAMLCGGLIGLEREYKRRAAGFRTHILICLGAAMTTMTGQYLALRLGYTTDMGRLGAQVVAGIGFIGAGAILVTKRSRVKGLTTAAGLWTAAIVGLACGYAFYEGAVCTTALILLAEVLFVKLEYRYMQRSRELNVYLEYQGTEDFDGVTEYLRKRRLRVKDLEFGKSGSGEEAHSYAVFSLQLGRGDKQTCILNELSALSGIVNTEEL